MSATNNTNSNNGNKISVTGINEAIKSITNIQRNLVPQVIVKDLDQAANESVNLLKRRSHRITGKMQAGNKFKKIDPKHIQVYNDVYYSIYEERRYGNKAALGPHKFFEPTVNEITNKYVKKIEDDINRFLKSA